MNAANSAATSSLSAPLFQDLVRSSIEYQWNRFAYYRQLCARQGLNLPDLLAFIADDAYHRLPSVVSSALELPKGVVEGRNGFSGPGFFQVSSSPSGDPSYVYASPEELESIPHRYSET